MYLLLHLTSTSEHPISNNAYGIVDLGQDNNHTIAKWLELIGTTADAHLWIQGLWHMAYWGSFDVIFLIDNDIAAQQLGEARFGLITDDQYDALVASGAIKEVPFETSYKRVFIGRIELHATVKDTDIVLFVSLDDQHLQFLDRSLTNANASQPTLNWKPPCLKTTN